MSSWPRLNLVRGVAALATSLALVGCGATGLDWVAEAHLDPGTQRTAESSANTRWTGPAPIPAATDLEPVPEPAAEARPRLNRTITLGEVDVVASSAPAPGNAIGPGVSVTINNYNSASPMAPAYGYSAVGYGRSARSFSVGDAPRSGASSVTSAPQPGQNWPAAPDYGSSFPYRSAPASPWARTR